MKEIDKNALRDKWARMEAVENSLLRQLTIQGSVAEFDKLHREFRVDLEAEDETTRRERFDYLANLQERLHRLATYAK